MAHSLVTCKKCGHIALFYTIINKISCVYCKNFKLDLGVKATVPPGKIKVQPADLSKAPLFSGLPKPNKQSELF